MSYERQNSTDRLARYRARVIERTEAMIRAVEEGRTRVVSADASQNQSGSESRRHGLNSAGKRQD